MALKQNIKQVVKVSRKTFFNPSGWLGLGMFASQINMTADIARNLFTPAQPRRKETFEQAVSRLKLTEIDITEARKRYLVLTLFFLLMGGGLAIYGFYLILHHGSLSGLILAFSAAGLSIINAFRFHFLAFQIAKRKLGCTFEEWWSSLTH